MNYTGSAPALQPVPELPEPDLPIAPNEEESSQGNKSSVIYLRLLWEHRRSLTRAVIYVLLASTLIASLTPLPYESTSRLMPPDSTHPAVLPHASAPLSPLSAHLP